MMLQQPHWPQSHSATSSPPLGGGLGLGLGSDAGRRGIAEQDRQTTASTFEQDLDDLDEAGREDLLQRRYAVRIIWRTWTAYTDRQTYLRLRNLLKHTERTLAQSLLRRIAPREAQFFRSEGAAGQHVSRIRLRLGLDETDLLGQSKRYRPRSSDVAASTAPPYAAPFPPIVLFKVFLKEARVQYLSGARMLPGTSPGARDACRIMGPQRYAQVALLEGEYAPDVAKPDDVVNGVDLQRYRAQMDDGRPERGGRANPWRPVPLEFFIRALPRPPGMLADPLPPCRPRGGGRLKPSADPMAREGAGRGGLEGVARGAPGGRTARWAMPADDAEADPAEAGLNGPLIDPELDPDLLVENLYAWTDGLSYDGLEDDYHY
ncbi:hypothetical protein CXG81DRAFT_23368 [Caulochytrium protostelioides]|uniref:Uncharacterized protein n=1 Tax=Caulochytrium protostelioides TaxID=1555241 RepID=A0A4P9XEI0_9FUNG|nr:hypothetical protein CXG81DRAFT_23368 [Caulochytrium protostelioides]|eukprot:RKP03955.1 hypothetical protein CXG81DRAFT_23368 [Caulochytrium protostelioides]